MKALILGASGMLGHRLHRDLSEHMTVIGAVRTVPEGASDLIFQDGLDLSDGGLKEILGDVGPDVVVNAIGLVKQLKTVTAEDHVEINALLPHRLCRITGDLKQRLIHFSTDCVFSGRKGPYVETDYPDAEDVYGRTKLLGEVNAPHALTLRTSIIGHELKRHSGFLGWVLTQKGGEVKGFARALYTGLTTNEMSRILKTILTDYRDLCGVWHFSADAIDKYELIRLIDQVYDLALTIHRDENFRCDRRLDSHAFRLRTGLQPKSWPNMIYDMYHTYQNERA